MKSALGTGTLRPGFTRCADDGGTCPFSGTRAVAFGAGTYTFKTATGSTACTGSSFGGDPAANTMKSCYVADAGGPPGHPRCAGEGGTCPVPAHPAQMPLLDALPPTLIVQRVLNRHAEINRMVATGCLTLQALPPGPVRPRKHQWHCPVRATA